MQDTVGLRTFVCPQCANRADMDPRFVQWCTSCGYGADPQPPKPSRRDEREQRRAQRLFESLRTAPDLRPTSLVGVCVTVISTLVHLVGLMVLVVPIVLVVRGDGFWSYVALLFGLLTFWTVRPRLPLRSGRTGGIERDKAPALYALLDRCAAELGCPVPERVFVDRWFNAATGRGGLKFRPFLVLGVPLWSVLTGPERIALLGHELGHQVNGDPSHGVWAGSARRSVHEWTKLVDPRQSAHERRNSRRGGLAAALAPLVMAVVCAPFFLVAVGARALLTRLDLYCGQRAEYLADELGARLGGSEATISLLGKLALSQPVQVYVGAARNASKANADPDRLWPELTQYLDSIPDQERERRRIVDRIHNTRTDRTHPANHLREALVEARPRLEGSLELDEREWAAIDAELAPYYRGTALAVFGRR